jgi:hypothetical protein
MGLGGIFKGIGKGLLNVATGGISGTIADLLGAGGSAAGAMSHGAAQNRDAQFSGQMDLASLLMQRDAELQRLRAGADNDYTSNQIARENSGMATRGDAWHKLLSAQHTLSPAQMPNVSPYAAPQRQATGAEQQGANALTSEVMARLEGGNPIAGIERRNPTLDPVGVDPKLLRPGGIERFGGILSPILSGIGGIGSQNGGERGSVFGSGGSPGSPVLSASDLAWLRTQSPRLVA